MCVCVCECVCVCAPIQYTIVYYYYVYVFVVQVLQTFSVIFFLDFMMISISSDIKMLRKSQDLIESRLENFLMQFKVLADTLKKVASTEQVETLQREVEAVQREVENVSRVQSHLQSKQDQLASKQDLLHSTLANERPRSSSVMSSPMLSPPVASWMQQSRSIPQVHSKTNYFSDPPVFKSDAGEQQQPICIDDDLSTILDDISSTFSETFEDRSLHTILSTKGGVDSGLSTYTPTPVGGGPAPRLMDNLDLFGGPAHRKMDNPDPSGGTAPRLTYNLDLCGGTAPRPDNLDLCGGTAPRPTDNLDLYGGSTPRPTDNIDICGGSAPRFRSQSSSRGPSKLKSVDDIMQANPQLCSPANIKALIRKLAREVFFGDHVLLQSTVTGKAEKPLDEHKLDMLQTVVRAKVYPDMTVDNFKDSIWPQCKEALATLCKALRRKAKKSSGTM